MMTLLATSCAGGMLRHTDGIKWLSLLLYGIFNGGLHLIQLIHGDVVAEENMDFKA